MATAMPSKPLLRPLNRADRAQWSALWRDYLAFYHTELPEAQFDTTFAALLDDGYFTPRGIVAEIGGQLVGLVHFIYHAHCWKPSAVCYLQDLYVAPATRGTGLGRALIARVYAEADRDALSSVYWLTQEFNAEARQLYDRIATLTPFIKYQR